MVTFWVPLLLAIAGAAVGAYFAIVRTKRERLWTERYERIGSALEKTDLIERFLDSGVNGEHQSNGLTTHEKARLDAGWPSTRHELATEITMLKMLFSESEFAETDRSWIELQTKLSSLMEGALPHDGHEYYAAAHPKAEQLKKALIDLSRAKCLGWF